MSEHIELPENEDVEGHFQLIDEDGRAPVPPTRRLAPSDDEDDDVAAHVLDLDIERKR